MWPSNQTVSSVMLMHVSHFNENGKWNIIEFLSCTQHINNHFFVCYSGIFIVFVENIFHVQRACRFFYPILLVFVVFYIIWVICVFFLFLNNIICFCVHFSWYLISLYFMVENIYCWNGVSAGNSELLQFPIKFNYSDKWTAMTKTNGWRWCSVECRQILFGENMKIERFSVQSLVQYSATGNLICTTNSIFPLNFKTDKIACIIIISDYTANAESKRIRFQLTAQNTWIITTFAIVITYLFVYFDIVY